MDEPDDKSSRKKKASFPERNFPSSGNQNRKKKKIKVRSDIERKGGKVANGGESPPSSHPHQEPIPFDFFTEEDYKKYDDFVKFCEESFAYIDMEDVNKQIALLKSRGGQAELYLSNVVTSSGDEGGEDGCEREVQEKQVATPRKEQKYRKNLKLINIKKHKRARINVILIRKKYTGGEQTKGGQTTAHQDAAHQTSPHQTAPHHTPNNTAVVSPIFMPVGTKSCIKGLVQEEVQLLCNDIILSNTYHLANIFEMSTFVDNKGINNFIRFPNAMLTDSGGFQMVSLSKRITILEEGILFDNIYDDAVMSRNVRAVGGVGEVKEGREVNEVMESKEWMEGEEEMQAVSSVPADGATPPRREIMLTPETSIRLQNQIGSDIIMALDDVRPATETDVEKIEEATHRTNRWLQRCIQAHSREREQTLFGIIQGGLHIRLRNESMEFILKRRLNGYAVGGLCGGERKGDFFNVVHHCSNEKNRKWNYLPENRCRYIMGIGYLADILFCSILGYDMYDCVYASRTARFNTALSYDGTIKLKQAKYAFDFSPLVSNCHCYVCSNFSKSALHLLISKKNPIVNVLLTIHNIYFTLHFCYLLRVAIFLEKTDLFVTTFLYNYFVIGCRNGNYKIPDNDKAAPGEDTSNGGPIHPQAKNTQDEAAHGEKNEVVRNTPTIPTILTSDEPPSREPTQPSCYPSTCTTPTAQEKVEMVKELKDKLPHWALQALQYAEIGLTF
ncbi:queuine tRNA-ribosyltransferase [Plasmodium inui San Antonio 1]|uniref:Queuine tRNA-ribosyltransferase n=1 Tax=Plasmodium inui San Antonio 1 TaxID=1237626 RepID=W6ZWN1_9APIC|nr:queuine tRNA-ribosyltransferase [Plasmodium inui San Antonio 1]EUD65207.1 queuine tRNA-ribosyltransferase [Plasmodium inui San Antonio 1]